MNHLNHFEIKQLTFFSNGIIEYNYRKNEYTDINI